jgi:hypothetical protein
MSENWCIGIPHKIHPKKLFLSWRVYFGPDGFISDAYAVFVAAHLCSPQPRRA